MRIVALLLAVLALAAAGAQAAGEAGFVQIPDPARAALPQVLAGLALAVVVALLVWRQRPAPSTAPAPAPIPAPVPAQLAAAPSPAQIDAEIVHFLGLLQEKGRFVDFLMDEIAGYSDAEVGAAGRVLHEGCRSVLKAHFGISPVRTEPEGARVTVPAGFASDEYRLVGRIGGEPPFTGALVHHGWKADWVKLPRLIGAKAERPPAIAPAEVELG